MLGCERSRHVSLLADSIVAVADAATLAVDDVTFLLALVILGMIGRQRRRRCKQIGGRTEKSVEVWLTV